MLGQLQGSSFCFWELNLRKALLIAELNLLRQSLDALRFYAVS